VNKRERKPKGQSEMDNTETLATLGILETQYEDKQNKKLETQDKQSNKQNTEN
jgi:hypothetical protein